MVTYPSWYDPNKYGAVGTPYPDDREQVRLYLRDAAERHGLDPDQWEMVGRTEALNAFHPNQVDYGGDDGTSFGPLQMRYGGGLADDFTNKFGIPVQQDWRKAVDYAVGRGATDGLGYWHGWKGDPNPIKLATNVAQQGVQAAGNAAQAVGGAVQNAGSAASGALTRAANVGAGAVGDVGRSAVNAARQVAGVGGGGGAASIPQLQAVEGRNPDMSRVDPRLLDIMRGAQQFLPQGYSVRVLEGYNPNGHVQNSMHHQAGAGALDMVVYDPQGRQIPNEGNDPTGVYHILAQGAYTYQQKFYPDLNGKLAWGGAFGTVSGGQTPDLMHFDLGGERGHFTANLPSRMGPLQGVQVASTGAPGQIGGQGVPQSASAYVAPLSSAPAQQAIAGTYPQTGGVGGQAPNYAQLSPAGAMISGLMHPSNTNSPLMGLLRQTLPSAVNNLFAGTGTPQGMPGMPSGWQRAQVGAPGGSWVDSAGNPLGSPFGAVGYGVPTAAPVRVAGPPMAGGAPPQQQSIGPRDFAPQAAPAPGGLGNIPAAEAPAQTFYHPNVAPGPAQDMGVGPHDFSPAAPTNNAMGIGNRLVSPLPIFANYNPAKFTPAASPPAPQLEAQQPGLANAQAPQPSAADIFGPKNLQSGRSGWLGPTSQDTSQMQPGVKNWSPPPDPYANDGWGSNPFGAQPAQAAPSGAAQPASPGFSLNLGVGNVLGGFLSGALAPPPGDPGFEPFGADPLPGP